MTTSYSGPRFVAHQIGTSSHWGVIDRKTNLWVDPDILTEKAANSKAFEMNTEDPIFPAFDPQDITKETDQLLLALMRNIQRWHHGPEAMPGLEAIKDHIDAIRNWSVEQKRKHFLPTTGSLWVSPFGTTIEVTGSAKEEVGVTGAGVVVLYKYLDQQQTWTIKLDRFYKILKPKAPQ